QGKTRLATQLINELTRWGWAAGFVRENPDHAALAGIAGLNVPIALVLDYAETRPVLLDQLAQAVSALDVPVRLLLLARTAGDWRDSAAADHDALAWLPDTPVRNLGVLEPTVHGRIEAWRQAVTALADHLQDLSELEAHNWSVLAADVIGRTPDWLSVIGAQISVLGIHLD